MLRPFYCRYSDAVTCNAAGTALETGGCVCNPDRTGEVCDGLVSTAAPVTAPAGGTDDRASDGGDASDDSSSGIMAAMVVVVLLVTAACVAVVLWKRKRRSDAAKEHAEQTPPTHDKFRLFSSKRTANTMYRSEHAKKGPKGKAETRPP